MEEEYSSGSRPAAVIRKPVCRVSKVCHSTDNIPTTYLFLPFLFLFLLSAPVILCSESETSALEQLRNTASSHFKYIQNFDHQNARGGKSEYVESFQSVVGEGTTPYFQSNFTKGYLANVDNKFIVSVRNGAPHLESRSSSYVKSKANLDFREPITNKSKNFSKNLKNFHEIILNANLSNSQKQIVNDLLNNPQMLKKFFSKTDLFPSISRTKRKADFLSSPYITTTSDNQDSVTKISVNIKRNYSNIQTTEKNSPNTDKKSAIITSVGKFHIDSNIKATTRSPVSREVSLPQYTTKSLQSYTKPDIPPPAAPLHDEPLPLPLSQAYKSDHQNKYSKTAIDHFFDRYQQFLQTSIMVPEVIVRQFYC